MKRRNKQLLALLLALVMSLSLVMLTACGPKLDDLTTLVASAETKVEKDYSATSWAVFKTALANAKEALATDKPTQEAIDSAKKALEDALAGLKTDKTALEASIKLAEAKVEADYSVASWAVLMTALNNAKTALTATKQSEIDSVKTALDTAVAGLKSDKSALDTAITTAEAKVEGDFLPENWTALQEKLTEAKAVKGNASAKQSEINKVITELNELSGKGHGTIVWTEPVTKFVLTNDIVRYREDREQKAVVEVLSNLLTATLNGVPTKVIIDTDTLPIRNVETGLYTIGSVTLTYQARGDNEQTVSRNYVIDIVDGKSVDYYFYGKNSDVYATPTTVGGNARWNGGVGIRVGKDNFFALEGALTELPEALVYSAKLKDFDDPIAIQNKTTNSITFKCNDNIGAHILMDASGKVKMMYDGTNGAIYTSAGKEVLAPAAFGNRDIVMEAGDIYLVIGGTIDGNWYSKDNDSATKDEEHWKDGRYVAEHTIGMGDSARGNFDAVYNVCKLMQGETLVTTPYVNQKPYLYKNGGDIALTLNATIPTDATLLSDMKFYDDGGAWGKDVAVAEGKIVITNNIDTSKAGAYAITYTVTDDTIAELTFVVTRKVTVNEITSNYFSYVDKNGAVKMSISLIPDASAVTVVNAKAPSATGYISIYTAEYFNLNKNDNTKISPCNFGIYVIIDGNGNFVKSYFNTNMIDVNNPVGAKLDGSVGEAATQAKTETLEEGQFIMFFQQNGASAKVRDFAVALRDNYKSRIGEGGIKIVGVGGLTNSLSMYYMNGDKKELLPRTYAYNPATYNPAKADITIFDNKYTGTFVGFGYGCYVKVDATGKVVEVYDGANAATVYNAENPSGVAVPGGNSNILKGYDFTKLLDGERIYIFPNNGHIAAGGAERPKTSSYALDLRMACKGSATVVFNAKDISLVFSTYTLITK